MRFQRIKRVLIGPVEKPVGRVGILLGRNLNLRAPCLQQFTLGDEARVEHAVEHHIGARLGRGRIAVRRVGGWRFEQAREDRRFRQRDVAHRFSEIELRSRFDAIGAAAQIGAVEIEFQDFLFRQACFDPQRQESFVHFSLQGARGRKKEILGHLLRDG